jgi:hypothetical protein
VPVSGRRADLFAVVWAMCKRYNQVSVRSGRPIS